MTDGGFIICDESFVGLLSEDKFSIPFGLFFKTSLKSLEMLMGWEGCMRRWEDRLEVRWVRSFKRMVLTVGGQDPLHSSAFVVVFCGFYSF